MGHGWDRVELTIGSYTWTVRATDTAADALDQLRGVGHPNKGVILDGLTIAWETDESRPGYSQPRPWEADFSILVENMTDLTLATGDRVCIKVWARTPGETYPAPWASYKNAPLALFLGRIADVDALPVKTGTVYVLQCVDYTADLMEIPVGATDWPAQAAYNRIGQITAEAGIVDDLVNLPDAHLVARPAAITSVYDAFNAVFQGVVDTRDYFMGIENVISVPVLLDPVGDTVPNGGSDTGFTYKHVPFSRGLFATPESAVATVGPWSTPQPGRLGGPTTAVDIVIAPLAGRMANMQAFPASNVLEDLTFQYRKGQAIDSVTMTLDNVPAVTKALANPPLATFVQETLTDDPAEQADAANFLLPDQAETGWAVDSVTLVNLTPAQVERLLIMVPDSNPPSAAVARNGAVTIYDIPARRSADGTTWYAGTPTAARLVFNRGRWSLTLALARRIARAEYRFLAGAPPAPASDYDGYLSCDNLRSDPIYSATRYVDVVDAVTHYDLRIVRSHDG